MSDNQNEDLVSEGEPTHTGRPNTENLSRAKRSHDSMIVPKIVHDMDSEAYTDDSVSTEIDELNFNWAEDAENKEEKQARKTARRAIKKSKRDERAKVNKIPVNEGEVMKLIESQHETRQAENSTQVEMADTTVAIAIEPSPIKPSTFTPKKDGKKRGRPESMASTPSRRPRTKRSKVGKVVEGSTNLNLNLPTRNKAAKSRQPSPRTGAKTLSKTKLTKREERGSAGQYSTSLADGMHLYMKLPKELREPGAVMMEDVVNALIDCKILGQKDMQTVYSHDSKGWIIACTNRDAAKTAVGSTAVLQKRHAMITMYQSGGATTFITDHTNEAAPEVLIRGIAGAKQVTEKKLAFWLGLNEFRGIRGSIAVIAFEQSPGFHSLDVPLGDPAPGYTTAFMAKFRAVSLATKKCEVCKLDPTDHPVLLCPRLQTHYTEGQDIFGKSRLLKTPPTIDTHNV